MRKLPTPVAVGIEQFDVVVTTACASVFCREIEKFIIRQPPIGEKDDYDSKNS